MSKKLKTNEEKYKIYVAKVEQEDASKDSTANIEAKKDDSKDTTSKKIKVVIPLHKIVLQILLQIRNFFYSSWCCWKDR